MRASLIRLHRGPWAHPLRRGGRAAVVSALLVAACGGPPSAEPLRIGINPWPGFEFLYLAEERGFFDREGIPVRLVEFSSLGDVRRAFEHRQIDAMATTVTDVLLARAASGRDLEIILATDFSAGSDVILARVESMTALAGRAVAIERASLGSYLLARALEESGLSLADVRIVHMDQSKMAGALDDGEVDAVVTYPPVMVDILRAGRYHEVFTSERIPREILDVIAVDAAVLSSRPGAVAALRRAWAAALVEARTVPQSAFAMMAQREGLNVEEFSSALLGLRLIRAEEQADLFRPGGDVERAIDGSTRVLLETGAIRTSDAVAAAQFLDAARAAF